MGFLAKLLAPHVVGVQEPGSSQEATPSTAPATPLQIQSPIAKPTPSLQPLATNTTAAATPGPYIDTSSTAHLSPLQRKLKELSLLALGAGFMLASVAVTRRAVVRRQREAIPRFFHISHQAPGSVDSGERSTLAAQALGLATLNVASFGVFLFGGISWAFDLCSMAELQARTQTAIQRGPGEGVLNEEDEREVDNMVIGLMERLGMDVDAAKERDKLNGTVAAENTLGTLPKA